MMISKDLASLRAVLVRRADLFQGQIFLPAEQAAAVLTLLDSLHRQTQALEQLIYGGMKPLPPDVIDLDAARCRPVGPVAATPTGGSAA